MRLVSCANCELKIDDSDSEYHTVLCEDCYENYAIRECIACEKEFEGFKYGEKIEECPHCDTHIDNEKLRGAYV